MSRPGRPSTIVRMSNPREEPTDSKCLQTGHDVGDYAAGLYGRANRCRAMHVDDEIAPRAFEVSGRIHIAGYGAL